MGRKPELTYYLREEKGAEGKLRCLWVGHVLEIHFTFNISMGILEEQTHIITHGMPH